MNPLQSVTSPPWRLLPAVLGVAFAARVAVVLSGDFIYHYDVVFQYYEPAWRLLTGHGLVVWEQFYGARPQLIPAALALLMGALLELGIDHPTPLRTAVEVVLCGWSMLIPWGMYAFARSAFDEFTGRAALLLAAFWYEFVALAGQPLSETLALAPLLWAFAFALDPRSPRRCGALGLLLVAACALRFQYAPLSLFAVALAWPRMASPGRLRFLGAAALALGLLAAFDLASVGTPVYRSYMANLLFNLALSEQVAAAWSGAPWWYQPLGLAVASGGLAVAGVAGDVLRGRSNWALHGKWLLAPILLVLAVHAAAPVKEYRFVLATAPFWLIGLASLLAVLWSRKQVAGLVAGMVMGIWFVFITALGMLVKLPSQAHLYSLGGPIPLAFIGEPDPRLALGGLLAGDEALAALAQVDLHPAEGLAQVHLGGEGVPIFDGFTTALLQRQCGIEPKDYASRVIVPEGSPVPAGFPVTLAERHGWRLATTGTGAPPPLQFALDPVSVVGLFGESARQFFEADPEDLTWPGKLWAIWAGDTAGEALLPAFRPPVSGDRPAPALRIALPPECAAASQ